uniref:F-box domain-containing protein n=1 Tax=Mycena chlorophos TaxID=658473 RepID=A0ABQ0LDR2_MYCCL|nr:predicted protein [Mycena chlorophos]
MSSVGSPVLQIPPELIEQIAAELAEDNQLSRHHRPDWHGEYHSADKVVALLGSDPRISVSVTHLELSLGLLVFRPVDAEANAAVQTVLSELQNLRYITLDGRIFRYRSENSGLVDLGRLDIVRDLLAKHRGRLVRLTVNSLWRVPLWLLHCFLTAAPNLKFSRVVLHIITPLEVERAGIAALAADDSSLPRALEVDSDSSDLFLLLRTPPYEAFLRNLRETGYTPRGILSPATLERLVIDVDGTYQYLPDNYSTHDVSSDPWSRYTKATIFTLPDTFPCLREVEFHLQANIVQLEYLSDPRQPFLRTLLSPVDCPAVEEIIFKIKWMRRLRSESPLPAAMELDVVRQIARKIDGRLGTYPQAPPPRCTWLFQLWGRISRRRPGSATSIWRGF